ncbi:unnamed protein product [Urochloa humidicola]
MAASTSEITVASRRIVDYLNDGEELGVEGAVETPPCTPAAVAAGEAARSVLTRFRWPRLVRIGKKGGGAGKGKWKEEEVVVVEKGDDLPVVAAASTSGSGNESAAATDTKHSDLSVGLSLVFLLAKTSDEFNKMVKVRTEMEALLKEIKDEVRIKSCIEGGHVDVPKDCNRESTTSSCVTDGNENDQGASARMEYQAASSGVEPESYEKSFQDGGCCDAIDVFEEEFQTELEQLKVQYSSETPSFLPEQDDDEHYSEPYDEMAEYGNGVDDDSGEVVEDEEQDEGDNDDAYYNGVSAVELERKLHELLHERNRVRIEELEAALQCAEKKLLEKEMEVSLWKDTAKLALRQDNEQQ